MKDILLVIPAYNEELNILKVVDDINKNMPNCDYIFINDCSKDKTGELLDNLNLNHIDLPINLGLSGAVQMGFKYAYSMGYKAAMQFDGDGQHQAKYVNEMLNKLKEGYDIVIGSRFVNQKKNFSPRMWGSRIISFFIWLRTGKKINDPTSGMRMMNEKMIKDYSFNMNRKPEPDTLAYHLNHGAKLCEVQVEMNEREFGNSMYGTFSNSIKYMINMLVSIIFFS